MKQKLLSLFLLVWAVILSGCETKDEVRGVFTDAPDYVQAEAWFDGGHSAGKDYDVFYIVPTCVFDQVDENGDTCHYMDIRNELHRLAVDSPLRLAKGIFADEANFFAPYYRQITIESWMKSDTVIESRFRLAYEDIVSAFRYYTEHLNEGRPFILAGHSQGGKAVIELLKREMDDELYARMIAAYPLGYPVEDSDVSPYLLPAADASGTGVFVTFNSVSAPDRLPPLLAGSRAAINPLNWRTDDTPATKEDHLGSVFIKTDGSISSEQAHVIGACLDKETKALVVSGVNPEENYTPSLAGLFPVGNYHVVELNFFYRNLQQNVKLRAATFFQQEKGGDR